MVHVLYSLKTNITPIGDYSDTSPTSPSLKTFTLGDQTEEISSTLGGININNSAEELLSKMMNQTFQINIRGRKVPFDIHDDIFSTEKAAEAIRSS